MLAQTLHRHQMLANLAGRERDANVASGHALQEAGLLQATGRLDRGVQSAQIVIGNVAGHGHFGAGANRDLVALATLAGDLGEVRRSLDVLIAEANGHLVLARSSGQVLHGYSAVFVVMVVNLQSWYL